MSAGQPSGARRSGRRAAAWPAGAVPSRRPAGAGPDRRPGALGSATRGTTNPNRLRRVDNWIAAHLGGLLRSADDPLVVDLGFGATPVTAIELRDRLAAAVRPDVRVIGLEIDGERVAAALASAKPPGLDFRRGGFELAGLRPVVVRAMNVLRQYDESAVDGAYRAMLASGAVLVEGTCDELGRVGSWIRASPAGRLSLTLAADLSTLDTPATLAERLPKALIHHNVPGERVHDLIAELDRAWRAAAALATFGTRQRWAGAVATLAASGWPVLDRPRRWRLGEVTVAYRAVSPD